MKQGGIFNGLSAIGTDDATYAEMSEASSLPGFDLFGGERISVPETVTDLETDQERAAIVAADVAKMKAKQPGTARSGGIKGAWNDLSQNGKVAVVVGGLLLAAWALPKVFKGQTSYAANPKKRPRLKIAKISKAGTRKRRFTVKFVDGPFPAWVVIESSTGMHFEAFATKQEAEATARVLNRPVAR